MTYALCADVHAHNWSQFATTNASGINSRLQNILDELERMAKEAKRNGCKRIYVAGDTFHVRGSVKPSVLNPVSDTMSRLARELDITWRVMVGNHDLEATEAEWLGAAIVSLGEKAVDIIVEPTWCQDDRVALVPWVKSKDGLAKAIDELRDRIIDGGENPLHYDLHLHTGINGVLIGVPDSGWMPEELAAAGFKRVFSGHYHAHKVFLCTRPGAVTDEVEIVSIGALTHQTWSDVDTRAGWMLVADDSFIFHDNAQPKFRDLDVSTPFEDYKGDYVRVRGLELEDSEIAELKRELEAAGAAGIVVHAVGKSKVTTRQGVSASKAVTVEASITSWIKSAAMNYEAEIERESLDILSEVRGK